jgi:hypothetical protein
MFPVRYELDWLIVGIHIPKRWKISFEKLHFFVELVFFSIRTNLARCFSCIVFLTMKQYRTCPGNTSEPSVFRRYRTARCMSASIVRDKFPALKQMLSWFPSSKLLPPASHAPPPNLNPSKLNPFIWTAPNYICKFGNYEAHPQSKFPWGRVQK